MGQRSGENIASLTIRLAIASSGLGIVCLWPQINTGPSCRGTHASRSGLVERQLLCYRCEQFLYVLGCLCGCFEEEESGFFGVLLSVGGGYGTFVGALGDEIELVAGKGDDNVLVCLSLKLLYPGFRFV
jgi:hypothetical protein